MPRQFRSAFTRFQNNWRSEKSSLVIKIARTAENQFKDNFNLGGFMDSALQSWRPRKKADTGRAILVKSGRLKRGIRAIPLSNLQEIKIGNDVPYAQAHNEGLGHLPQRKFIGESQALNGKIKGFILNALNKIF